MNLLRRFVLAGAVATAVDVVLLVVLVNRFDWPVPGADVVAVAVATVVSWLLHGLVSFPTSPSQRWYRRIEVYLGAAVTALVADVVVISVLDLLLDPQRAGAVVVIKIPALAVAFAVRTVNYRRAMFAVGPGGPEHPGAPTTVGRVGPAVGGGPGPERGRPHRRRRSAVSGPTLPRWPPRVDSRSWWSTTGRPTPQPLRPGTPGRTG